ncbi:MAG: SDR family oxidoreductase [Methylacidiphilales bacterium]|nr:SDR family oxidoreductase [Candidatus Methylacidiphilales bacterium]MDW8349045.1 SDR family oxidoreductase [Verrucomicrobiae bacterium]
MTKKIILITGAAKGLGAALARHLANSGYLVAVHYRTSRHEASALIRQIQSTGGLAQAFQADLSIQREAEALLHSIHNTFGDEASLFALINNAGTYHDKNLYNLTETEWLSGLHSTATATFHTIRAALPYLRKTERARIINIGDSGCDRPTARDLAISYHIGKVGVYMLTRSFARTEARYGITVNLISPGWLENSINLPPPSTIPAGRYGTFQDVASAVDFLLSPTSQYLTGSNLILSGGWNLR